MQDVMRLLLTRTVYETLLIIGAAMVGAAFPITPKHNSLLGLLTVGLPPLALALWARSGAPPPLRRPAAPCLALRHPLHPAHGVAPVSRRIRQPHEENGGHHHGRKKSAPFPAS
jgi:hypothetical protein